MKNSNIDVDIIDETLLYICINGKREHISVDNARIKYKKNTEVLGLIDSVLNRYQENSKPLEGKEDVMHDTPSSNSTPSSLDSLNNAPLMDEIEIDLGDAAEPTRSPLDSMRSTPLTNPSKEDLDKKPLEAPPKSSSNPEHTVGDTSIADLNHAPLGIVDETKFASIYEKYNGRIRETFPTDSPSFLDVEKLTRNDKPLEQTI